jgi:hypothetical protein
VSAQCSHANYISLPIAAQPNADTYLSGAMFL